jgi:transposase
MRQPSRRAIFDGFIGDCRQVDVRFSPYLYRAHNRVERFFNRIKQFRRVATRYDNLAANYLAFVQLASIRLRLDESTS